MSFLEEREGFMGEAIDEADWEAYDTHPIELAMVAPHHTDPAIAVMFSCAEGLEPRGLLAMRWIDECARATRAALPEVAAAFHLSCGGVGRTGPWATYRRG